MSVHVTQDGAIASITSTAVVLKLTNLTSIDAKQIEAWELIEGDLSLISAHFEDLSNMWIDESTIVNISFPVTNGDTSVSWFSDDSQLYYWQDGRFHYADSSVYNGDTSNFEPVSTTVTNNVSESWSFSLAYEVDVDSFVYAPITKAVKISIAGIYIVKYFRGTIEIFPSLVEDWLPPSIYKTDIITIGSDSRFDFRTYTNVIAGIAISCNHRRRRRDRSSIWQPAGAINLTWYNSTAIDASVRKTQTITSQVYNFNAHGGCETIEKDFAIECTGGSSVEVSIRTLHYPVISTQANNGSDLTQLLNNAIVQNS